MAKIDRKQLPMFIQTATPAQMEQLIEVFVTAINDLHEIVQSKDIDTSEILRRLDRSLSDSASVAASVTSLKTTVENNSSTINAVAASNSATYGLSTEQYADLKALYSDGIQANSEELHTYSPDASSATGESRSLTEAVVYLADSLNSLEKSIGDLTQFKTILDNITKTAGKCRDVNLWRVLNGTISSNGTRKSANGDSSIRVNYLAGEEPTLSLTDKITFTSGHEYRIVAAINTKGLVTANNDAAVRLGINNAFIKANSIYSYKGHLYKGRGSIKFTKRKVTNTTVYDDFVVTDEYMLSGQRFVKEGYWRYPTGTYNTKSYENQTGTGNSSHSEDTPITHGSTYNDSLMDIGAAPAEPATRTRRSYSYDQLYWVNPDGGSEKISSYSTSEAVALPESIGDEAHGAATTQAEGVDTWEILDFRFIATGNEEDITFTLVGNNLDTSNADGFFEVSGIHLFNLTETYGEDVPVEDTPVDEWTDGLNMAKPLADVVTEGNYEWRSGGIHNMSSYPKGWYYIEAEADEPNTSVHVSPNSANYTGREIRNSSKAVNNSPEFGIVNHIGSYLGDTCRGHIYLGHNFHMFSTEWVHVDDLNASDTWLQQQSKEDLLLDIPTEGFTIRIRKM